MKKFQHYLLAAFGFGLLVGVLVLTIPRPGQAQDARGGSTSSSAVEVQLPPAIRVTHHPDHEPAAPVVPDEIDRAAKALQLGREPVGVLVHRRSETGRTGAVEPGKRQRDGIGVVERSHEAAPDGGGFWHSMDEYGGHGSHSGTAVQAVTFNVTRHRHGPGVRSCLVCR